jgi:hypothetical protein
MKKFPQRTAESDAKAMLVVQALQRCHNVGQNYMVTVVTSVGGRCFVALSGSNRALAEGELQTSLHWTGQLNTVGPANKGLRKNLANLKKTEGNLSTGAHAPATALHPLRENLLDPEYAEVVERNFTPLTFNGNRDCAEPKALQAAANAGAKITGMTTVWYGNGANDYPDPLAVANGIAGNYARPCAFCRQNEERIMIEVERAALAHRGGATGAYEV